MYKLKKIYILLYAINYQHTAQKAPNIKKKYMHWFFLCLEIVFKFIDISNRRKFR